MIDMLNSGSGVAGARVAFGGRSGSTVGMGLILTSGMRARAG